jgi:superfamily II DNA or RNA helicase
MWDVNEDVTLENGEIRIKSDAEKLQDAKLRLLEELKTMIASLLAPTDYVTIKIAEAAIVGQETDQLKQYYASALAKRQQIRQFNADMKQAIARAKTLEELKQLRETIFQATNSLR